jgi:cell division protein FtsB
MQGQVNPNFHVGYREVFQKEYFVKKILFFITVATSLFIIKDLVYSIYTLWHKNDLLIVAQRELIKEKKENLRLKTQLSEVKRPDFVESEARNKLFLTKPGESVVILPSKPEVQVKSTEAQTTKVPWQQWVNIFFTNMY